MLTNKIKPAKYILALCLIGAVVLAVVSACGAVEVQPPMQNAEVVGNDYLKEVAPIIPITDLHISFDMQGVSSLSELVYFADIIVIGRYTGTYSSWNSRQDPLKIQERLETGHSFLYTEVLLYDFVVDEVLMGEVSGHVIPIHHRLFNERFFTETNAVINESGIIVQPATKQREFSLKFDCLYFVEPIIGPTYILFLTYAPTVGQYGAWFDPFSIMVAHDGTVKLQITDSDSPRSSSIDFPHPFLDGQYISFTTAAGLNPPDIISGQTFDDVVAQIRAYIYDEASAQLE